MKQHLHYTIRLAREDDVALLPVVDLAAAAMFLTTPFAFIADGAQDVDVFSSGYAHRLLWVAADAGDRPVGYALAREIDDTAYLAELAVDPVHGRRGLGSQLIETVCQWAKGAGYDAVTLSTFRDVAWNAPFYEQRGFRMLDEAELGLGLLAVRAAEAQNGLPIAERVFMRRDLQRAVVADQRPETKPYL